MKTDDLIAAISADAKSAKPPIASMVWLAAGAGVIGAAVVFFSVLQVRPDIGEAIFDPHLPLQVGSDADAARLRYGAGDAAGAAAAHFRHRLLLLLAPLPCSRSASPTS